MTNFKITGVAYLPLSNIFLVDRAGIAMVAKASVTVSDSPSLVITWLNDWLGVSSYFSVNEKYQYLLL